MRPFRHRIGKLARTWTLAVLAVLLPASLAHAGHGPGGGHTAWAGSGASAHHGHHPDSGGYGWTWGGYYPSWGYDPFYGAYYGYGGYNGSVALDPYFGVYAPFWGGAPFGHSTRDDVMNFMASFR